MPSKAIRSFSYDESRNELTVTFVTGRGYVYSLVPAEIVAALKAAFSKGSFINAHIRDRYPYRPLKPGPEAGPSLLDALKASRSGEG